MHCPWLMCLHRCEDYLPNATGRCAGGMDAGVDGEGYCAAGYLGPLCLLCQKGKGLYLDSSGACSPCPDVVGAVAKSTGVALACVAAVAICILLLVHPKCQRYAALRRARNSIEWLKTYAKSIGLMGKTKIVFSFVGVVTVLDSTYDARLPAAYTDWIDKVRYSSSGDQVVAILYQLGRTRYDPTAALSLLRLPGL